MLDNLIGPTTFFIFPAIVLITVCVYQYVTKSKNDVVLMLKFQAVFSVVIAWLAFDHGRSLDTASAGSWGFGQMLGSVAAGAWIIVLAINVGTAALFGHLSESSKDGR